MGEETVRSIQVGLGDNRQYVSILEVLRASRMVSVVLSGGNSYTSGQSLLSVTASSVVIGRPLNIHFHNRETSHMTVVFRDGGISGSIFAGPYKILPETQLEIALDKLVGRRFTSGIYAVVISGTYSAGIDVNLGYLFEPSPVDVGGFPE